VVIDATIFGPGDLKCTLNGHFSLARAFVLSVFVTSFLFPERLPRKADFLMFVFSLIPIIIQDLEYQRIKMQPLANTPAQTKGQSYLTIMISCTGREHRSVFVA
jgi:RNase adaptor protein for sRNA GlmZ degradation